MAKPKKKENVVKTLVLLPFRAVSTVVKFIGSFLTGAGAEFRESPAEFAKAVAIICASIGFLIGVYKGVDISLTSDYGNLNIGQGSTQQIKG